MAASTRPALFRFHIMNRPSITDIEYVHPVPEFLCTPSASQKGSQEWADAFIDVISLATSQHHDECMQAITSPCVSCQQPANDALKTPISCLHLAEPMVMIQIDPVCGSSVCDIRTRQFIAQTQEETRREEREHEKKIYRMVSCKICGKEDAKRCAGCGSVAYCGKECQKAGWKAHKQVCMRKNLADVVEGSGLPYEEI